MFCLAGVSVLVGSTCAAVAVKPHGFIALSGVAQLGFTLLGLNLSFSVMITLNFFYGLALISFIGTIWSAELDRKLLSR